MVARQAATGAGFTPRPGHPEPRLRPARRACRARSRRRPRRAEPEPAAAPSPSPTASPRPPSRRPRRPPRRRRAGRRRAALERAAARPPPACAVVPRPACARPAPRPHRASASPAPAALPRPAARADVSPADARRAAVCATTILAAVRVTAAARSGCVARLAGRRRRAPGARASASCWTVQVLTAGAERRAVARRAAALDDRARRRGRPCGRERRGPSCASRCCGAARRA